MRYLPGVLSFVLLAAPSLVLAQPAPEPPATEPPANEPAAPAAEAPNDDPQEPPSESAPSPGEAEPLYEQPQPEGQPPSDQPPQGQGPYGQGPYGQPPYGQEPYQPYPQPGYGLPPPQRPVAPPPKQTLLWSLRYDPFDLLFRRVTIEGEIALGSLPLSIELAPSWIFDSPADGVDESGFDISARFAWYVQGEPLEGFWVKAHAQLETFKATLYRGDLDNEVYFGRPNPELCDAESKTGTCERSLTSFILGAMIGNSTVFGENGGFAITGGIGIGVAVTSTERLEVQQCTEPGPHCPAGFVDEGGGLAISYNDNASRIRLLGSLSLGVSF